MKRLLLLFAALLVAGCGEKQLSDSAIKKALDEAVENDSLQERNGIYYRPNESEPYRGWVKLMHNDSEQVKSLAQCRDGRPNGLFMGWHENGQKVKEGMMKDGKEHGLYTEWHENGQKRTEVTFKDGEPVSATKHWNSKGEEVDTSEEAFE